MRNLGAIAAAAAAAATTVADETGSDGGKELRREEFGVGEESWERGDAGDDDSDVDFYDSV